MKALNMMKDKSCFCFPFVALILVSLAITRTFAEEQYHEFVIEEKRVKRLCTTENIVTVNGLFPGPTLEVRNGDTVIIKTINKARYNITLHWHGIRQLRTAWADGPAYVTQCPIKPGESYTYRFTIVDQEGTLWWHAHLSWLRATVHGALVIYPKEGSAYPFPKPQSEFPLIIGEWWRVNPLKVIRAALQTGGAPNVSDAFTINGQPGDLYPCSSQETTVIPVIPGQTVMIRLINAALNQAHFFAIGGHSMTVVAADAQYTKPFSTNVLMIEPGQTTDVLVTANQPPGRYYIAARAYASAGQNVAFDNTTTTAILQYKSPAAATTQPLLPGLPAYNDTPTATAFTNAVKSPQQVELPGPVDERLFFTVGLGVFNCPPGMVCNGPVNGTRFASSVNNVSFVRPRKISILEAHALGVPGIFTDDFPAVPPIPFNYTAANISQSLWPTNPGTKVYRLHFGSVVEVVFQGTNIINAEDHPMHLHGHHFYVLGRGFGNFNPNSDPANFNLVDPPQRNTLSVPINGWAAIRFVADNPGVWLMHCHIDTHLIWGLAMVFVTDNGLGELEALEPRPIDLPICD